MNLKQWKLKDGRTYKQIANDLDDLWSSQWIAMVINGKKIMGSGLAIEFKKLSGLSLEEILESWIEEG